MCFSLTPLELPYPLLILDCYVIYTYIYMYILRTTGNSSRPPELDPLFSGPPISAKFKAISLSVVIAISDLYSPYPLFYHQWINNSRQSSTLSSMTQCRESGIVIRRSSSVRLSQDYYWWSVNLILLVHSLCSSISSRHWRRKEYGSNDGRNYYMRCYVDHWKHAIPLCRSSIKVWCSQHMDQ